MARSIRRAVLIAIALAPLVDAQPAAVSQSARPNTFELDINLRTAKR